MPPIDIAPVAETPPPETAAPAAPIAETAAPAAPIAETAAPSETQPPQTEPATTEAATTIEPGTTAPATSEPGRTAEPSYLEKFGATTLAPGQTQPGQTQPGETAAPIVYDFKIELPEGIELDKGKVAEYSTVLQQHGISQEAGQQLLQMHTGAIQDLSKHLAEEQWRAFEDTRRTWRNQIAADEQLGGAGHQTTMQAVARMRDMFVSTAPEGTERHTKEAQEFEQFLRVTGAGDHPAFIRMLHNAARIYDEAPPLPQPPRPQPQATVTGRAGGKILYDHPSSGKNRNA